MNDEVTQPEEPQKELTVAEKKIKHRGVLDKLPLTIRQELNEYIRAKNPSQARERMIEKYSKEYPLLAGVTKVSYYKYAKRHDLKGVGTELRAEIASTPPELLTVIEKIADSTVPLNDKKAALTSLYNDCAATSKKLESTQTNFLDPQIQAVILANRKQMCTIIEKLSTLNDQLSKDSDKDWLSEAEYIVQICTSGVVNSYKITHSDQTLFAKFMTDYRDRMTELMKAYRATKETLKKEPVKLS
ncbi:MAG: hypothetical protein ACREBR_05220 [bacterium]